MSDIVFLYTTAPDADCAERIARVLISEKLAACVNIFAEMRSLYEWDGEVALTPETPIFVKTTAAAADRARDKILALHPFDTPCVAALPIGEAGSSPAFLAWIKTATIS